MRGKYETKIHIICIWEDVNSTKFTYNDTHHIQWIPVQSPSTPSLHIPFKTKQHNLKIAYCRRASKRGIPPRTLMSLLESASSASCTIIHTLIEHKSKTATLTNMYIVLTTVHTAYVFLWSKEYQVNSHWWWKETHCKLNSAGLSSQAKMSMRIESQCQPDCSQLHLSPRIITCMELKLTTFHNSLRLSQCSKLKNKTYEQSLSSAETTRGPLF